jgi:hypothetical protein
VTLEDPRLVAGAVASTLGLMVRTSDYDKRGLPEPLVLSFHFWPREDEIVQLIILRNLAGT